MVMFHMTLSRCCMLELGFSYMQNGHGKIFRKTEMFLLIKAYILAVVVGGDHGDVFIIIIHHRRYIWT